MCGGRLLITTSTGQEVLERAEAALLREYLDLIVDLDAESFQMGSLEQERHRAEE